ncbi:hypothetical protein [Anabaena sp. FACHB-1237]|nr:hypothetical protein [Anabaena sp. FACHB-1237]
MIVSGVEPTHKIARRIYQSTVKLINWQDQYFNKATKQVNIFP